MRRPTNISLPTQIHELVVSTYFLKFINKETLAVLLYQAMVTLLNASLNLLTITWNLLCRHFHLTSRTRPTFFSNSKISARSPKTLSSSRLMFFSLYTNIPHKKGGEGCRHFLNTRPLKSIPTERICDLIRMILGMNSFSFNGQHFLQTAMAPQWPRAWHLPMKICSWEISNSLPSKTPLWKPFVWWRYIDDIFMIRTWRRR